MERVKVSTGKKLKVHRIENRSVVASGEEGGRGKEWEFIISSF